MKELATLKDINLNTPDATVAVGEELPRGEFIDLFLSYLIRFHFNTERAKLLLRFGLN
ncbi:hypothetical protein [Bacillus sp. JCM 19034]|uniref:hypothetical protein n=1 Tax=Bacillus sp. JCM 19034 TaxID=1481928 RepID=UPI000A8B612C|nr:hypothetical protein [Bacillus sp. JCM 19034]